MAGSGLVCIVSDLVMDNVLIQLDRAMGQLFFMGITPAALFYAIRVQSANTHVVIPAVKDVLH